MIIISTVAPYLKHSACKERATVTDQGYGRGVPQFLLPGHYQKMVYL